MKQVLTSPSAPRGDNKKFRIATKSVRDDEGGDGSAVSAIFKKYISYNYGIEI